MKATLCMALGLSLAAPALAHADQCEYLPQRAMAERAVAALRADPLLIHFCELCNEQAPGEPTAPRSIELERLDDGWTVTVDASAIDLAYTFVRTAPDRFTNLAHLAGCPTQGVSTSLQVTAATDSGVLISTAPEPPEPAPSQPAARPQLAPPSAPALPSQTVVLAVSAPAPAPTGWRWFEGLMFLLGAAASAMTCGVVLRHRRRVRHVPRAVALVAPRPEQPAGEAGAARRDG